MAHHLAELINAAKTAEGPARQEAEDRAAALIVKLWANRHALPPAADPMRGYRDAAQVLARLHPSADPWFRFRRSGSEDDLLHDIFGAMVQLVMTGLLLTREGQMRAVEEVEREALTEEERFLLDIFDRWRLFFTKPAPQMIDIDFVLADALDGGADAKVEAPQAAEEPELDSPEALRAAILQHAETVQNRFAELIEQWRSRTVGVGGEEAGEEVEED
jgi:hypothetical protein